MSLSNDYHVDKIRRELKKGAEDVNYAAVIPKEMFLDFVEVYGGFHAAGPKLRPRLVAWMKDNKSEVRKWLPEIEKRRPHYFDMPSSKDASDYKEHDELVAMGFARPVRSSAGSPELGSTATTTTHATADASESLIPFGTAISEKLVRKNPELQLSGKVVEEAWLADATEAKKWLELVRAWFTETAERIGPQDELYPTLLSLKGELPSFRKRVKVAQACLDEVKAKRALHQSEIRKRRSTVPKSFFDIPHKDEATQDDAPTDDDDLPLPIKKRPRVTNSFGPAQTSPKPIPNKPSKPSRHDTSTSVAEYRNDSLMVRFTLPSIALRTVASTAIDKSLSQQDSTSRGTKRTATGTKRAGYDWETDSNDDDDDNGQDSNLPIEDIPADDDSFPSLRDGYIPDNDDPNDGDFVPPDLRNMRVEMREARRFEPMRSVD
ncbi:hypothetical protein B0T17DRAFT_507524 [Bombardia bombarda]|uniref:Uncharacterized protein n=1 Tax=Bombardia bombarda TaxID=252184 RepID=A0AA39XCF5_9PEZI|nr:hypothetical protein B0T17DRAFT_507524 [Bombardia bombarda]